jgi:hypothetical protein
VLQGWLLACQAKVAAALLLMVVPAGRLQVPVVREQGLHMLLHLLLLLRSKGGTAREAVFQM